MAANHPDVSVIGHPDRYTRKDKEKDSAYWGEYWAIWPDILEAMKKNKVAFEINFNSPPSRKLVEMAAKSGVKFFLSFDAHDFNQFKKEKSPLTESGESAKRHWAKGQMSGPDEEALRNYKQDRLSEGPGFRALMKLTRQIRKLESLGVTPERVVNSSNENLLEFLKQRGRSTKNLEYLRSQQG